jgi:hypothetical protein
MNPWLRDLIRTRSYRGNDSKAAQAGWECARRGGLASENPWTPGSDPARAWDEGHTLFCNLLKQQKVSVVQTRHAQEERCTQEV